MFSGNFITAGIFHFQYDDQLGSDATIKFLNLCKRITNFPIINDNRAICLLQKYRKESNNLKKIRK